MSHRRRHARLRSRSGPSGPSARDEEDGAIDTLAFAHRDGRITAIHATRNPDKLQHVRF